MKKTLKIRWPVWLLIINVAAILVSGCASPEEHSFNTDYDGNYATEPMYYIYDQDDQHFRIQVHQGKPSTDANRTIDVKAAASKIAGEECKKLGWQKWQLNFIQERNQGWMRVVVAEVTRES